MPNYFTLINKATGKADTFNVIDERICEHFNEPVDPTVYFAGWYTVLGTLIAIKGTRLGSPELNTAIEDWYLHPDSPYRELSDSERLDRCILMLDIAAYLTRYYTSDAWATIGRRS